MTPLLFHQPAFPFVSAVSPTALSVRVYAEKGAVSEMFVLFKNVYDHPAPYRKIPMEQAGTGTRFEVYEALIEVPERHFRYYFALGTSEGPKVLTAEGIVDPSPNPDSFLVPMVNPGDVWKIPAWAEGVLVYQVLVDRFFDGDPSNNPVPVRPVTELPDRNTYYGGDFSGLVAKLGYLKELGVGLLYLSPVFRSPSYHKYDTSDYESVEAVYGGKEGLRDLVLAAHAKGIRIMLDGVFNHCSSDHPFFRDLLENQENSRFRDWFEPYGFPVSFEKANYNNFANQVPKMPRFNTANPEVASYLSGIAARWTRELGIDGWRLDVADEVAHPFWRTFRETIRRANPEALIVGESWSFADPWMHGDEWDTFTNYRFRKWTLDFSQGKFGARELWERLEDNRMRYPSPAGNLLVNLLGSHDTERLFRALGSHRAEHFLLMAFLLLYPGIPLIYYGDEGALDGGTDPDNRRAMDWDAVRSPETGFLADLGRLRESSPALRRGKIEPLPSPEKVLVFRRVLDRESWLAVLNFSPIPFFAEASWGLPVLGGLETPEGIRVPAMSAGLFKLGLDPEKPEKITDTRRI